MKGGVCTHVYTYMYMYMIHTYIYIYIYIYINEGIYPRVYPGLTKNRANSRVTRVEKNRRVYAGHDPEASGQEGRKRSRKEGREGEGRTVKEGQSREDSRTQARALSKLLTHVFT
jgi:hypothetical protein